MATGYEVQMYQDISNIAQALNRIANCMEAAEQRHRGPATTTEDLVEMLEAAKAVRRGFADLENAPGEVSTDD